uniref:Uncharacterized protein n=1 Tax=viral metagenome TaxID=1070528 RepID=A0A6M3Y2H3_9ZZZZ
MRKSGIAFHCHHNFLCEPVFDYDERVASIKETKPKEEQELRLRLFQLFPNDRLPQTLVKAWEVYRKAWEACSKAWEVYRKAWEVYRKAWEACSKAEEVYRKAREDYRKAEEAHRKDIVKLHAELCPDCPWDGSTIFTRKDKDGNWY